MTVEPDQGKDQLLSVTPSDKHVRFKCRHVMVALFVLGNFVSYSLRVGLSVALVAMVNSTTALQQRSGASTECAALNVSGATDNHTSASSASEETGEFDWDPNTQAQILGAFYYGYMLTQLPGGLLAERFGGKRVVGFGLLASSTSSLLLPTAARAGAPYVIAVRVLAGVCEGVMFPALYTMMGLWIPVYERSYLGILTFSGIHLGTLVGMPVAGVLCRHGFAGGWPSVFYVLGTLGFVWFLLWIFLAHDSPGQHPRISASERDYIEASIGRKETLATPWRGIATSPAVWSCVLAHCAGSWGFYGMVNLLPTFLKNILHFDIQQNGFLSAAPFLAMWAVEIGGGFLSDYLRANGHLSTTNARKLMELSGSVIPALLLVATGYSGCNPALAVGLLVMGMGGAGLLASGYSVNTLDIAPRFAGTLMGISNGLSATTGFICPALLGALTNEHETAREWRVYFYVTAAVYLAGALQFCVFGQGEEEPWAQGSQDSSSYDRLATSTGDGQTHELTTGELESEPLLRQDKADWTHRQG